MEDADARRVFSQIQRYVHIAICRFQLSGTRFIIGTHWSKFDHGLMMFALDYELAYEKELKEAVSRRLNQLGRQCFEQLRHERWPDHVTSPEALAYAMKYNELTPDEVASITFDHGDDQFSFVEKMQPEELVEAVWQQLMSGPFDPRLIPRVPKGLAQA